MTDMELLELFNSNEKKLYKKIVRGFEPPDNEYIMMVFVFLHNNQKKILLDRRSSTAKWSIPACYVEYCPPRDNVKRLCCERFGIDINTDFLKAIITLKKGKRLLKLFNFENGVSNSSIVIKRSQIKDAKFFSIKEIERLIRNGFFNYNDIMLIEYIKDYLK